MFSKKSYDGPPAGYGPPTGYGAPTADYGYGSPPPGSYYVDDAPQLFYKWTSPPGAVRGLQAGVLVLCIAIFACVASTLAWDYGYGLGGAYGTGLGGFYGSNYYGSGLSYSYGYGGYYGGVNQRTANGFMIAMAVLCFLAQLGLLVAALSKSGATRSRRFYLAVLVLSAVLAFVMLIASIVYIMGVNPQAQMSSGYYYSPLLAMCSQAYGSTYLNQYIYHYCTVDPQEVSVNPPRPGDGRTPGPPVIGGRGRSQGERFGVCLACPWAAVGCGVPILNAFGMVSPSLVLLHWVEGRGTAPCGHQSGGVSGRRRAAPQHKAAPGYFGLPARKSI